MCEEAFYETLSGADRRAVTKVSREIGLSPTTAPSAWRLMHTRPAILQVKNGLLDGVLRRYRRHIEARSSTGLSDFCEPARTPPPDSLLGGKSLDTRTRKRYAEARS